MLRTSLPFACALAFAASASAQITPNAPAHNPTGLTPKRITGPIKYGGIYHVATDTWTRRPDRAIDFGSTDIVYSNTAESGFFGDYNGPTGDFAGGRIFDDGGLPGTTNPGPFAMAPNADSYTITGFQIGYCDYDVTPDVAGWDISFYESFQFSTNCPTGSTTPTPARTYNLTGLPSGDCWVIDIDLTGMEVTLGADGGALNPGFDGDPDLDAFGWSCVYTGTGTGDAGFIIAGDPQSSDPAWTAGSLPFEGTNTYYGPASNCVDPMGTGLGTGYLTEDLTYFDDMGMTLSIVSGCYDFFGYLNTNACIGPQTQPYASWWMEMSSNGTVGPTVISDPAICMSLPNSSGAPATLQVTGSAVPANNDAVLEVSGLPFNQFGIFVAGRQPATPFMLGNGLLCIDMSAGGGLGRFDAPNQILSSGTTGVASLDTNNGGWNLASIETSVGTYAASAGITSYFQFWYRDSVGAAFNFSDAVGVTWQ